MFDRSFLQSKLGRVSAACITAMCAFVLISTQMQVGPASAAAPVAPDGVIGIIHMVGLA